MSGKTRWLFQASFPELGDIPPQFVKIVQRPQWKEDKSGPVEKGQFITSYIGFVESTCPGIYDIFAGFYKFGVEFFSEEGVVLEDIRPLLGTAKLEHQFTMPPECPNCHQKLFMGFGNGPLETMEEWTFNGVFPTSINFGDLCFSSNDEIDLEITWRYGSCEYTHMFNKNKEAE